MYSEFCKKLGMEHGIFAFSHCRDVVAAVSNHGGMGVLGAGWMTPEQFQEELNWLDEHVGEHHYGVDIVIPQSYMGMDETDPQKKNDRRHFRKSLFTMNLIELCGKSAILYTCTIHRDFGAYNHRYICPDFSDWQ